MSRAAKVFKDILYTLLIIALLISGGWMTVQTMKQESGYNRELRTLDAELASAKEKQTAAEEHETALKLELESRLENARNTERARLQAAADSTAALKDEVSALKDRVAASGSEEAYLRYCDLIRGKPSAPEDITPEDDAAEPAVEG